MNLLRLIVEENQLEWGDLYYFRDNIEMIFSAEKRITENSEEYVSNLVAELEKEVSNDSELASKPSSYDEESYQAQYYDHYFGEAEQGIEQILQSQRKASILSIYSLIEGQLKLLCNLIQHEFTLKAKGIRKDGNIKKYHAFLSDIFKVDSSQLEEFYNPIIQQKYIRDIITHNNSNIKQTKVEIIKQTEGLEVLSFGKEHELLIIDNSYVNNLRDNGYEFFMKLIKLVNERYKVMKK